MILTLPCPPSVNAYWRRVGNRTILSAAARDYRDRVERLCLVHKVKPLDGTLLVSIRWYRPAKRGDTDNIAKGILDALQGLAYRNDSQIARLEIERDDSDPGHARVEVSVSPYSAQARAA